MRCLLTTLDSAGWGLKLDDGGETIRGDLPTLLRAAFSVDVATLFARKDGHSRFVSLVFGNDGWDVIADCSGGSFADVLAPVEEVGYD